MAILLGALLIHNIKVGPLLIKDHPTLFWGVLGSMYVGNVMLLVLNVPLIGIWVKILKIPYPILFPLILLFCLIGVYSVNNNIYEVVIMILFGVVGYLMKKFAYEGAPLILAFVLSPLLENALRQSLIMSNGDFSIFFSRPISLLLILASLFLLFLPLLPGLRKRPQGGNLD
jgi:putative tricarboxylic transport membrane protein